MPAIILLLGLVQFIPYKRISAHNNALFVQFIEQETNAFVDTSINFLADSTTTDSLLADSSAIIKDTLWYTLAPAALDAPILYKATDSIVYDLDSGKTYLYNSGEITYTTFFLKSDYVVFDWSKKTLHAMRLMDSAGNFSGPTYFKEGEDEFSAESMSYNFDTKKGKIYNFRRKEGEGFIVLSEGKKNENNEYYGDRVYYTTCELDHPHYYIIADKAKIVPKKIAVTGPANLVIADVPTPLFLPFGLFPIQTGRSSGLIIPSYGYSFTQGYFLRDGGYYFAINDYMDLALTGDIYSQGSWRLDASSSYAKRYKFRGNMNVEYALNKYGLDFAPDYSENTGFFIRWNHSQDPKARPNSVFGANVSFGSTNYLQNNSYNENYLTNSYNSSVSYTQTFGNSPFSLNAALRQSQNTATGLMNLTLPDVTVNMTRIYPFKNLAKSPKSALNQFGISYSMAAKNYLSVQDSLLFEPETLDKFQNGFSHQFSFSAPFKLLKYFTLTPALNYTDNMYFQSIRKTYDPDTVITEIVDPVTGEIITDTLINYVRTDTIRGFENASYFNLSASLSTKLYGYLYFKGKLKGFRHTLTPSLSFNYKPDYADPSYGYYGTYQSAPGGEVLQYSIFEGGIFSGPSAGKSGTLNLNLGNNLEMKVYSKKDTVTHEKRLKLIESFSVNSGYNYAVDSLNFSYIGLSGYTTLFNKFRLNVSSSYDPYVLDTAGRRINKFEWDVNNRLGRLTGGNFSVGTSFRSARKENPSLETESGTEGERNMVWDNPQYYIDFEVPWQFNISYNLNFTNLPVNGRDSLTTTQTLNLGGDINFTPNWKLGVSTGYDFELLQFTYTAIDIYRNLHCWEMSFHWIPFGARRSYFFTINVKASVLQDLKLNRKRDWNEYNF